MRVSIKTEERPAFEPYDIILHVDSEEDSDLLRNFFGANLRIPEAARIEEIIHVNQKHELIKFMGEVHRIVVNQKRNAANHNR